MKLYCVVVGVQNLPERESQSKLDTEDFHNTDIFEILFLPANPEVFGQNGCKINSDLFTLQSYPNEKFWIFQVDGAL